MKNILAFILFLTTSSIFAQSFEINGTLQDQNNAPIESATVYVTAIKDSTMISYTISDKDGHFSLIGKTKRSQFSCFIYGNENL